MEYVVRVWVDTGRRASTTNYYEFERLDEAQEYADWITEQYKTDGYEFDVLIYEKTSY